MSDRRTLIDTNILLDIFTDDPTWGEWSSTALAAALDAGSLVINPLIYAELSISFQTAEELDAALRTLGVHREPLPYDAAFPAASAFVAYRRRGGARASTLPDFYIGAHALCRGYALLTRDRQRYDTYFPQVELIAP